MEEYFYIALAVVAVLVVVVLMYAGSVYVMREKSFESALVEQNNKLRRELLEQTSNKQEKKVRRQQVRGKQLEKSQTECTNDVVANEAPVNHSPASKKKVELELEPKIIMFEDAEVAVTQDQKPSSPSKPAKSILLNKDEKGQVLASTAVPGLFHRRISVDEFDLKMERHKSDTSVTSPPKIEADIVPVAETRLKVSKKKKSKVEVLSESVAAAEVEVSEEITATAVLGLAEAPGNSSLSQLHGDHANNEKRSEDKRVTQLLKKIEELKRQLNEKEKILVTEKSQLALSKAQIIDQQEKLAAAKQRNDEMLSQKHRFDAEVFIEISIPGKWQYSPAPVLCFNVFSFDSLDC